MQQVAAMAGSAHHTRISTCPSVKDDCQYSDFQMLD